MKIATDRAEKDNRDRWMAIRALGLIGDASVVPDLIHLVYYPNTNTRFMAQIALVQLTGQNFGMDWQAWVNWWNSQPNSQPKVPDQQIAWTSNPEWNDLEKIRQSDKKFIDELKQRRSNGDATEK